MSIIFTFIFDGGWTSLGSLFFAGASPDGAWSDAGKREKKPGRMITGGNAGTYPEQIYVQDH
jgi:hypothetical protein